MHVIDRIFHEYEFAYYLQPGKWLGEESLKILKDKLIQVNKRTGRNLNYGIFDTNLTREAQKSFFDSTNICLITEEQVPIGFFYNVILEESPMPVIHAGLVMLSKNSGHDLMSASYAYMTYLQYRRFGNHYYTNISSTPSIVGVFSDSFSDVWPSYKANQIKPPSKQYLHVLDILEEKYIKKYLQSEDLQIDKKRFVLKSASKKMGFETNLKKLSRYSKPESNYFCMFWLDYSMGEDLIQVGKVNFSSVLKLNLFFFWKKIRSFFRSSYLSKSKGMSIHRG